MTPPLPPSSTPSTFFTANGGDVILRAGPDLRSKHDFRVHKVIISLASSVFEDMFGLPQPPGHGLNEAYQLPIVDVPDSPDVLDKLLRLIYPGVEPPEIADIPTVTALLSAADKYNIMTIYPVLRDALKTFLRGDSFRAYVVACRFGFLEEAREAAKFGTVHHATWGRGLEEEVQHISSVDLLRWVTFVQQREDQGRLYIRDTLDWTQLGELSDCRHGEGGAAFYSRLRKAVKNAFAINPCVGSNDLFAVLDRVPDPPPGCPSLPNPGEFYRGYDDGDAFNCPLLPMSIRNSLIEIAEGLDDLRRASLDKIFGKELGSS